MISAKFLPDDKAGELKDADEPAVLNTANGPAVADKQVELTMDLFEENIQPLIMPHAPPILSLGKRIMHQRSQCWWPDELPPVMLSANGVLIELLLDHEVPILREDSRILDVLPDSYRKLLKAPESS